MATTKNFSSRDVNETAEKIYASVAEKSLEDAYGILVSYFAEAKTKVIKQAILRVRLRVLLARISALRNGIYSQKDLVLNDLVTGGPNEVTDGVENVEPEIVGESRTQGSDEGPEDDSQLVTVSITQDVEVLGTKFSKGMIVCVPRRQLNELIETGKAEVVENPNPSAGETVEAKAQSDEDLGEANQNGLNETDAGDEVAGSQEGDGKDIEKQDA